VPGGCRRLEFPRAKAVPENHALVLAAAAVLGAAAILTGGESTLWRVTGTTLITAARPHS